jgi:threonine dehydrogenase-like Zn-dependent dehydrogenase
MPWSSGIYDFNLGAGPTGLILAQLLKQNGAAKVVIAANKGMKMDIARQLEAADEYIELDRKNPEAQWAKIKEDYKYGFDIVVRTAQELQPLYFALTYPTLVHRSRPPALRSLPMMRSTTFAVVEPS